MLNLIFMPNIFTLGPSQNTDAKSNRNACFPVYVRCQTVDTCASYHSFVSGDSGGIIVFLCFVLYDVTGVRFTPLKLETLHDLITTFLV